MNLTGTSSNFSVLYDSIVCCNNTKPDDTSSAEPLINSSSILDPAIRTRIYLTVVPILIVLCVLAFIVNICICISTRYIRQRLSVTQRLSISLAGADAYAACVLGLGLVFNSLLPIVYGKKLSLCWALTIEAFRLGGIISIAWHLLALAINHYMGIARPLHYAQQVTRRRALVVIVFLWVVPIVFFLVYFAAVGGLRVDQCTVDFILFRVFRQVVASVFFIPLACMTIAYAHIFVVIRRHQRNALQSRMTSTGRIQSSIRSGTKTNTALGKCSSGARSGGVSHNLASNVKAVVTTLLILGTYIVGWLPAVTSYVLICDNCYFHPSELNEKDVLILNIIVNILVILKCLVDPIIYTARMPDISRALRVLFGCQSPDFNSGGTNIGQFPLQRVVRCRSIMTEHTTGTTLKERSTQARSPCEPRTPIPVSQQQPLLIVNENTTDRIPTQEK